MAFDFGLRWVGVAVGSTETRTTQAVATLNWGHRAVAMTQLTQLLDEWRPEKFVVGLPLNMDGSSSDMAVHAQAFGRHLTQRFHLGVAYVDERLSSHHAALVLRQRSGKPSGKKPQQMHHSLAAELILQTYFSAPPQAPRRLHP